MVVDTLFFRLLMLHCCSFIAYSGVLFFFSTPLEGMLSFFFCFKDANASIICYVLDSSHLEPIMEYVCYIFFR